MSVTSELLALRRRDRSLHPADVVEFARNRHTALHGCFDWDDTSAASKYRLWQARQIITAQVRVIEGVRGVVQTFVSLSTDRVSGGGYRDIVSVMSNAQRRSRLFADALSELEVFQIKYNGLTELSGVFTAIRVARREAA